MTDEQKLTFLLNELKIIARQTHCYDGDYEYPPHNYDVFADGEKYSLVSFARSILESMGETYEQ
jgi:hypothetical protein